MVFFQIRLEIKHDQQSHPQQQCSNLISTRSDEPTPAIRSSFSQDPKIASGKISQKSMVINCASVDNVEQPFLHQEHSNFDLIDHDNLDPDSFKHINTKKHDIQEYVSFVACYIFVYS